MSVIYSLVSKAPKDTALILRSCFHTLQQYLCRTWWRHIPEGPPCTRWPCLPFIIMLEVLMNYSPHILVYSEIIRVAVCVNRAFHWKPVSSQMEGGLVGSHDKVFQANDTLNSFTSAMLAGSLQHKGNTSTNSSHLLLGQKQEFCVFKLSWLLKYTHVILTTGAPMTCFSSILFSVDPFQPDQKWVILVKKKLKDRKERGKNPLFFLPSWNNLGFVLTEPGWMPGFHPSRGKAWGHVSLVKI